MKRRKLFRKLSLLLIFALLVCWMINPAAATLISESVAVAATEAFTVPETLGVADTSVYTARLVEKESDLNTVVLKRADGVETMFYSSRPVKYVDSTGKTRDISTTLTRNSGGSLAAMLDNSTKVFFAKTSSDGITVSTDDIQIVSAPVGKSVRGTVAKYADVYGDMRTVIEYLGVFGTGTSVHYMPEAYGFKEEIILNDYPGSNAFSFRVQTGGLRLITDGKMCFFVDEENVTKAHIGEILVFDDNRFAPFSALKKQNSEKEIYYQHTYTVEEISPNREYILTMNIDNRWLTDPDTAYPVIIDPSITVTGTTNIDDCTVINYPENLPNYGSSTSLYVGEYGFRYNNEWEEARTWIKFPGLATNSTFQSISASNITDAKVMLRDIMCETDSQLVKAYIATASWSESSLVYNYTTYSSLGQFLDSNSISYNSGASSSEAAYTGTAGNGNWYAFDITPAVQAWKNGALSNNGIVFVHDMGGSCRTFASSERGNYNPVLKLSYNTSTVVPTSITLSGDYTAAYAATAMVPYTYKQFTASVQPAGAVSTVIWSTSNPAVATVSSTGSVNALGVGTAIITCMSAVAPSVSKSITVRVYNDFGGRAYGNGVSDTRKCLPYALNLSSVQNLDDYTAITDKLLQYTSVPTSSQFNSLLNDLREVLADTARINNFVLTELENEFGTISGSEYRICIRLFWNLDGQMPRADYHLLWQDSNGKWCQKQGASASNQIGFCNVTSLEEAWSYYANRGYVGSQPLFYKCDNL